MEHKFNPEKFKWTMFVLVVLSLMLVGQVAHDLAGKIQWASGLIAASAIGAAWLASPKKPKREQSMDEKLHTLALAGIALMIGIAYFGGNGITACWFVIGLLAIGTASSVITDKISEVVTYTVAGAIPLLTVSLLLCQEVAMTGVSTLS